jgi:hypothetical protein
LIVNVTLSRFAIINNMVGFVYFNHLEACLSGQFLAGRKKKKTLFATTKLFLIIPFLLLLISNSSTGQHHHHARHRHCHRWPELDDSYSGGRRSERQLQQHTAERRVPVQLQRPTERELRL